jgi:ubiquinol-cytochrome c reductase iron-sulfur subunit
MTHVNSIAPVTAADRQRRKLALIAVGVTGGAGLLATAVPFIASFQPSALARAEGGPVDVDISALPAGESKTVAWRGQPVWVMRRTPAMITALQQPDPALADPLSARSEQPADCVNATRSVQPDLFVAIGICTHLGCSPTLQLDNPALNAELRAPGGYLCPCHGSRFDLAGRVVKNVPAPTNLVIPPYRLTGPSSLVIG